MPNAVTLICCLDTQLDDTQHNDTQHNDTQLNDIQYNNKKSDTQRNDTQLNDIRHHNKNCDTEHNELSIMILSIMTLETAFSIKLCRLSSSQVSYFLIVML